MDAFANAWAQYHPTSAPIGFVMRRSAGENWVRFHSLPGSKRYPESAAEQETVISRANVLAAETLGEAQLCWLAQATPGVEGPHVPTVSPEYATSFSFRVHASNCEWRIYSALLEWRSGRFDRLIAAIADEKAAPTLWMSAKTGAVFAPYDGGTDLFVQTQEDVARLRIRFSEWLSRRSRGF
jgi:hypothetical protein